MSTTSAAPVVVGVDGSQHSLPAIDLAAGEAARRRRRLHVVSALHLPALAAPTAPGLSWAFDDIGAAARAMVGEAASRARKEESSLEVTSEVVVGHPAGVLVELSETAELLVVGHRGRGGFAGLLAGSVATQVAAHAHCPVMVTRPTQIHAAEQAASGRVVVGVHSGNSSVAVGFAFAEASIRQVSLVAVHVWAEPLFDAFDIDLDEVGHSRMVAARALSEAVAGYGEQYPDVAFSTELVGALEPGPALVEQSRDSGLIVVGTHVQSVAVGMVLGSTSHLLIHRAHCPVAVVHSTD